jgi:hypothetical protein
MADEWPIADWAVRRGELFHRGVKDSFGAALDVDGRRCFWSQCPGRGASDQPHWALQPLPSVGG